MYKIDAYNEAVDFLKSKIDAIPEVLVILGSGLGNFADNIDVKAEISYSDVPNFKMTTNASHAGKLIFGKVGEKDVVLMKGRLHFYEGFTMEEIVFPLRVLYLLGVKKLIVTNAAGAVNFNYKVGEFMLISDYIKLFSDSPSRGTLPKEFGPRFFDVSDVSSKKARELLKLSAEKTGIPLHEGVYAFMGGPQFETPAEIRMLRTLGADAVGMSTVPELIAASQCGMTALGVSCLTNMAAGILDAPVSDDEVTVAANSVSDKFTALIKSAIQLI